MEQVNVVWLKRDLRIRDHESLHSGISEGLPVILVYLFEPSLVACSQSDDRHWRFVHQSLVDLNAQLSPVNGKVHFYHMEVEGYFSALTQQFEIKHVFSHQETGIAVTFERDKRMKMFFRERNILWKEYSQQGVKRGRKNRSNWGKDWENMMSSKRLDPDLTKGRFYTLSKSFEAGLKSLPIPENWKNVNAQMQKGGEITAWKYFNFLFVRKGKKSQPPHQ